MKAWLCAVLLAGVHSLPPEALPYRLTEELLHAPTSLTGTLPSWLSGSFVRQVCGAFGPVGMNQTNPPTLIDHFFDCFGGLAVYHVNGKSNTVTFSSKVQRTHAYKVWEYYDFDFSKSGQAWDNIFGVYDHKRSREWANNWTSPQYCTSNPNVEMGVFGGRFQLLTEQPLMVGMEMNYTTMEMGGAFQYNDSLSQQLAPTAGDILLITPAHYAVDERGLKWSLVSHYSFTSGSGGNVQLHVYTIDNDVRTLVATYTMGKWDLSQCKGRSQTQYPDPAGRMSYVHSFAVTENFVVIPMSSIAWNPCQLFLPAGLGHMNDGRFAANWNSTGRPSAILVFDRRSSEFHSIPTTPFFSTHQAGSFDVMEDGALKIYADMFTYDHSPYDAFHLVNFLNDFAGQNLDAKFERFTINTQDWSLTRSEFFPQERVKEFPQLSPFVATKRYSYVYFLVNSFLPGSYIVKFNVQTNQTARQWGPFSDRYLHEPVFVPNGGADATGEEDDGVVLVGGFTTNWKGFLTVLDAKTMQPMADITAPQHTPPGIHNHFLP